ncbi:MAG: hypothetical protein K6A42_00690 [Treponema sp.]|nr:hypothetical protein [Treponema sp.]
MQKKNSEKLNTALSIIFLLLTLCSILYIAREKHHHCSGEHCPICQVLQIAEQNLKLFTIALSAIAAASLFSSEREQKAAFICESVLKSNTLVSQKVRLND